MLLAADDECRAAMEAAAWQSGNPAGIAPYA